MKSVNSPNTEHGQTWEVWRSARGYFGLALGKHGNPNLTLFRKKPKAVRGKAAVKAAKRARQRAAGLTKPVTIAA